MTRDDRPDTPTQAPDSERCHDERASVSGRCGLPRSMRDTRNLRADGAGPGVQAIDLPLVRGPTHTALELERY